LTGEIEDALRFLGRKTPQELPGELRQIDPDPQPVLREDANDQVYVPPRRVILCNLQPALLVYTGQVTNPATWPVDFVSLLAARLGANLKRGLMGADLSQIDVGAVNEATGSAIVEQG